MLVKADSYIYITSAIVTVRIGKELNKALFDVGQINCPAVNHSQIHWFQLATTAEQYTRNVPVPLNYKHDIART